MREQTITFLQKRIFGFFFFLKSWFKKLGVRLIHECGLYTSFYGKQNFFGTHSTEFIRFFQEMWIWKSCTYIFWKRRQVYIDHCRRIILPFYKAIFIIKNLRYCPVEYQSSHGAYDIISKKWRTIPCKSLQMFVLSLSHIVWLFIKFIKFVFLNWI